MKYINQNVFNYFIIIQIYYKMKPKTKLEVLKKYLPDQHHTKTISNTITKNNIKILDGEEQLSHQEDSQSSERQRIDSSEEQQPQQVQKNKKQLKDNKVIKKFKQAFGIQDQEQLKDFLKELNIQHAQGVNLKDLKNKKVKLELQPQFLDAKQQYAEKNIKLQNFINGIENQEIEPQQSQEGSDIEVNRNITAQPKTIYRNKDGTIRQQSYQTQKDLHKIKVLNRLGEWQKGIKQKEQKQNIKKQTFGNTQISNEYKIELAQRELFDDPMRVLKTKMKQQQKTILFECKYPGPGNRFNIKPGYRWDGVIRGNGFEFKYLKNKNDIKQKHDQEMRQYLQNL